MPLSPTALMCYKRYMSEIPQPAASEQPSLDTTPTDRKALQRGLAARFNPETPWQRAATQQDVPEGRDVVEVAMDVENDVYAVRNGGQPDGLVLFFTKDEWDAFTGGAQDGEFDVD